MNRLIYPLLAVSLTALSSCAPEAPRATGKEERLIAKIHDSGFAAAHDTYNGMGAASNGKIYYVLSSAEHDVAARMFSYDPASGKIDSLGDLDQACGQAGSKAIVQGKSHVNFVESDGKLYFASHIGFYSIIDGMEKPGIPPPGFTPYPGGHFLSFDIASGKFEDLGIAPDREGIISMTMDTRRGRLYGITWPKGYFLRLDLAKKDLRNLGLVSEQGEDGRGPTYRTLCRSLAVNPDDGSVYYTTGEGVIMRYRLASDSLEPVRGDDLKKDYFGLYDPTSAGHMGYNWRQVVWHEPDKAVYGVHGNSGYLFRFVPQDERVEVLERLTSLPSKRSGMFDQFSYGYLGFALGPDGHTLHYLTGGPVYREGRRVSGKSSTAKGESKGEENLHLVTYDIPAARYTDHGPIFFEGGGKPTYVNSIAVGKDGAVYALSRVSEGEHARTDLISIPGPFNAGRR
ncbi:MAG: hypothetical protein KIT09_06665 [Bryobacteraceae bacterium]|nr:hypothetical protein [Bryobacteraceae bacterium]